MWQEEGVVLKRKREEGEARKEVLGKGGRRGKEKREK